MLHRSAGKARIAAGLHSKHVTEGHSLLRQQQTRVTQTRAPLDKGTYMCARAPRPNPNPYLKTLNPAQLPFASYPHLPAPSNRAKLPARIWNGLGQPYRYASKLNANTGNYTGLRTGLSPCKHATNKPCGPYLGWRHVSTPTGLGLSCALATDKKTNQQFVNCRQGCTRLGHQRSR